MILNTIYTASLDGTAKTITAVVVVASAVTLVLCLRALRIAKGDMLTTVLYSFVMLLSLVVCLGSYVFSTNKYTVGNTDITINRSIGNINIHVTDILEVRPMKDAELNGLERVFADGGVFGYVGHYRAPNLGDMQWYATNKNHLVIIRTKQGDAIVISPDDKDFVGWILAKKADL